MTPAANFSDRSDRSGPRSTEVLVAEPLAVASDRSSRGVGGESWTRVVLPPVALGLVVLGLWYSVSYLVLDQRRRFLLEPPHVVLERGFLDGRVRSEIMAGLWSSTRVAMAGLALAVVIGTATAVIMSQSKLIERAIFPSLVVLQAIPILAIVPLIGFWFGYGTSSRIFVSFLIALFPIIVNSLFGLLSTDQGIHDLLTLHRAGPWTRLVKAQFPAALPAIFAGLRISAGLSVVGAIVGDFFFGQGEVGIGQVMKRYAARLAGAELLASVIVSCALGVAVFAFFGWLQNRTIGKWSKETRAGGL